MINTASKLYDTLLNICKTQYDNLSEDQKKKISVLNRPKNLTLNFVEDDLPPMPALAQAFTNCVHSYNRARNVQASGITGTRKFAHGIDFFV